MKTSDFLLSLLSSFRQFNDGRKFLAPMEILKIMRHVTLQQNLDTYSSCSLYSFSDANSFLPNSSNFSSNPQNPQPVTSMHNLEILSRCLSSYSVESQRPPTSTSVLLSIIPVPVLSPVMHLSCQVKMGVVTSQQRICKLNFFFHFSIQIL